MRILSTFLSICFLTLNSINLVAQDNEGFTKYTSPLPIETEFQYMNTFQLLENGEVTKFFWAEASKKNIGLYLKTKGIPDCLVLPHDNGEYAIYKKIDGDIFQKIIVSEKAQVGFKVYVFTDENELYPFVIDGIEKLENTDLIPISYQIYWDYITSANKP